MKLPKALLLASLFVIIFSSNLFSQIKIFRNLSVEDGLVQSYVGAIYQDSKGYMWFGTFHGLSRWDGIEFKNFHTINGLAGADINAIIEDGAGRLLVGTDQGLTIIDNLDFVKFNNRKGLNNQLITSLYKDKNKNIFVGTLSGLKILKADSLINISANSIIDGRAVISICGGDNGEVLLVVLNVGLVKYSQGVFTLISDDDNFADSRFGNSYFGKDGQFYFTTSDGFCKYDGSELKFIDLRNQIPGIFVRNIYEGEKGKIFIATNRGVIIYEDGIVDIINEENGLPTNRIMTISKDINGIYYFGTEAEGVALYDGGRIFSLNCETGLNSNRIYGITSLGKDVYISAAGSGIDVYNSKGRMENLNQNDGLPATGSIDLLTSSDGKIYAATNNGVAIIQNKKVIATITTRQGLLTNQTRCLAENSKSDIYIGSLSGLNIWDGSKVSSIAEIGGLKINRINNIFIDAENVVYIATETQGLIKFISEKDFEIFNIQNGLASNKVLSVYKNSDGVLFIGTQGGLNILTKNKIETLNTINGLSDNTIYEIEEDNYGRIYLTTNKGVNILNLSEEEISIRTLTYKNGLAGDECNSYGLHRDADGRMWFGTLRGISCYLPDTNKYDMNPPLVILTGLSLHEKSYRPFYLGNELEFGYNENYLKFNFIGVNLAAPEQMRYQYRLTNIDPKWVDTDYRFVRYADLNDGEYVFEVRAKNEGGHWSEPVGLKFKINAPFWKSWWFVLSAILFIGGTIALLIIFRIRQMIAVERLRTKLAADLHDNIGAGLTEISIMSEVIAQVSDRNNEHATNNLKFISKTARELVDSMSDIVWLVNPKRDSLYDLIIRLEESYRELLTQKGIAFQSKNLVALESISLPMDYRQNLYLIFKEAMNNSLKYSDCTNIYLNANVEGRKLQMSLKDNGKGFNSQEIKSNAHGVKNMNERAGNIEGSLDIITADNGGTEIIFTGKLI